jgi:ABC-2 type transport system ATP-binding protein
VIRVEGITHRFGTFEVLRDVWFHVPRGEIFGFIGPNGAGKTTTIRMMVTLLEPDDGRILIDGIDVVERPAEVRRLIGFMPDSFGVYERVTVTEYLEFFAAAHGIALGARARTVKAVMDLTELGQIRDKLVSDMSKGMKQRLAIARTLLHDPQVLVLDEPANGLDPRARIEMRQLIEELQRLGKTIVLSSHILTELSDMVTSVVILERGRVLANGLVGEIGRQLRPDRGAKIRLLRATEHCEDVFRDVPGVLEVERHDTEIAIAYTGGDEIIAALVAKAVGAGLSVTRVEPEQNDLERIFLEVTRGELQ